MIWYINENRVEFRFKNLFKKEDKNFIWSLERENFKDLFYRLDYNSIKVDLLNFEEKTLYLISNVFYEAGGYSLYYALILDLENKEILYQTPDLIKRGTFSSLKTLENGDIKISTFYPNYDFCRNCAFEIVDFIRYQKGKIISVNTLYQDEFKRIFETFKREDGCYILPGQQRLSFEEIKAQYGEDYQCRASDISLVDFRGATPKEYFLFKDKINKILNNEEIWVLN